MFGLSGDGFVTQSDCQNAPGCTFTWRDLAGAPGVQRDHMSRVTNVAISPDGRRTQLVALDAIESCNDGQGIFQVARGTLQLLDLATGAASFELPLRSNFWSAQGFTPAGDWFFAAPIDGTACSSSTTGYLSTSSPFAPPPGLDATDQFVQAVDARRWVVLRGGGDIGLADPLTPGSFRSLSGKDPDPFFDVTQGWLHVYLGFADLVRDLVSIPPTGPMRQTTVVSDEDWHPFGARGRWIRVCGLPKAEGYRNCRVIDARGELAPANFRITFALDRPDDAVLLGSGSVVFVGPTENGRPAVQRLEFGTGRREILHPGDGTLRPLGDGAAALLLQAGAAWLIEPEHEELVAERVTQIVIVPQLLALALGRGPGRQDDVAALVSASGAGRFTLALLDVRTRRLATVTDSLYFTPLGSPFAFNFNDGCGQPWTTRNAGSVIEGFFQQPQHLFFVEQGTPAALWLLPVDLSAPPRRLAELAGDPASCHAPFTSPDKGRVGFAENSADGKAVKITLSSE
ncbi:MAG TPA: hypothetical protein VFT22_38125 [Kofleriaceae bacterium]|nr:hypothetical protein [Kofleriaceae bacterium]